MNTFFNKKSPQNRLIQQIAHEKRGRVVHYLYLKDHANEKDEFAKKPYAQ